MAGTLTGSAVATAEPGGAKLSRYSPAFDVPFDSVPKFGAVLSNDRLPSLPAAEK